MAHLSVPLNNKDNLFTECWASTKATMDIQEFTSKYLANRRWDTETHGNHLVHFQQRVIR
jgi:hypothetical protein